MAPFRAFTIVKYMRQLAPKHRCKILGDQRLAEVSGKFMEAETIISKDLRNAH
jgi:hypothetical protein